MPPAPSRRSTRYRLASNSPTRSRAEVGRTRMGFSDSKTMSFTVPSRLKNNDRSRHGRPVDRTLIWVRSRIAERHRVGGVGPDQDHAVPEDLWRQPGRLDAVRAPVPGPRDGRARHDRVHGGVLASVVGTAEEDVSHRDLADLAAAAPAASVR